MPAPDVAALLSELERSEPGAVEDARTAVEWLTGGEPLESITQLDVCEFLWYTLPIKVSGDERAHVAIARALGRLLALGGLDRYAAICRSPTTAKILHVYARSGDEAGRAAYQAALDATGVLPPDVPELRWSSIMGPEELGAHVACSAALELAIVSGALDPGSSSWKPRREALTRRWLTEPRPELGGDNWLHRVHGERLNRWVLGRGAARRELAQPFEVRLHAPVPAPEGVRMAPLRWLLGRAGEPGGLALTQRHYLSRALAVEAATRFDWTPAPPASPGMVATAVDATGPARVVAGAKAAARRAAGVRSAVGTPRGEADVPVLTTLREVAQGELGALRRTGRRLVLTPAGRELLDDPAKMWDSATAALLAPVRGEHDFGISVREAALMLLADGAAFTPAELRQRIGEVVSGEGWRSSAGDDLDPPLTALFRRLAAFGLAPAPREARQEGAAAGVQTVRLNPAGRAAALAALRWHALRPRKYVSLG
ncbi:hypothetical protein HNP84_003892 [Thermocatellispora tengchongensis]|uniref:Uncharacterized protein n=1 Tax=Thermocatellispora tengchongensis TaxID=1073253 RepID=A0A840P6G1_9ACTN|nr:hypothetical protein [Thermocatellispora tengchongensis]MBB5134166.1 hypothetical protein [Thermocatellispora tengchongensis]